MPKLTAEEKKLLKAQKKEEKKRLAELRKRQQQHDLVSREVKYGKLTIKQHEKNWRQMLIDVALPRMREDLLFAWHNFERALDAKDFAVSLLMDEITDSEEQYMLNLRCHSENIDNLIIAFRDRLDELKESNESEIVSIQVHAERESEELQNTAAESEECLKTMLFGLEIARKEQEKLVRGDYLSKIDEETNRYNDILQNLRAGLEKTYSTIWDKTKAFLKLYISQKAERKKAYTALAVQDEALTKLCSEQRIKLQNMQETIKKLRLRYSGLQEIETVKIKDLLEERQYFAEAFITLRDRFQIDRNLDNNNIAIMTLKCNEAIDHLRAIVKKGRKILELSAICRKLETREEKILPFPEPGGASDNLEAYSDIKIDEYKNTSNLYLFWQRVAQADAVRHSINEEREALKRENKMLKSKIHNYCQCLDCPSQDDEKSKPKVTANVNVVDGYIVQKNYMKH